ncbi:hypothetical protein GCM10010176_089120 [Nonomuraea spiralis]|nr:hypothetical protein GCM10010176_089120 [Nonomuraea spiralis]
MLNWRKRPGQEVELNDILVDIETDKFILEFPTPATGVLAGIIKNEGDHVSSEELIAIIERRDGPGAPASAHEA